MDIKEIALNVADSLRNKIDGISHMQSNQGLVRFTEALIAEIAKQNEPVAEVNRYHLKGGEHWCKEVLLYSGNNPGDRPENRAKLFTFPPTAEQIANETADACAELAELMTARCAFQTVEHYKFASAISDEIRSGAWKEFKKS